MSLNKKPSEVLNEFIEAQKQFDSRHDSDQSTFGLLISTVMTPIAKDLTEQFAKVIPQKGPPLQIQVGRAENPLRLIVQFPSRPGTVSRRDGGVEVEAEDGAFAVFYCREDRMVVVRRTPFGNKAAAQEEPVVVCPIDALSGDGGKQAFGLAVVDFLRWAAAGPGRGSTKMRFLPVA